MSTQRYELTETSRNPYESHRDLKADPDGEWVRYDDHEHAIAEENSKHAMDRIAIDLHSRDLIALVAELRADLATVTADRDGWKRAAESQNRQWSQQCERLTEERAAHEATKAERGQWKALCEAHLSGVIAFQQALESTQRKLADMTQLRQKAESYGLKQDAALAAAEARVARVEALRDVHAKQTDNSVFSTALVEYINEALRG